MAARLCRRLVRGGRAGPLATIDGGEEPGLAGRRTRRASEGAGRSSAAAAAGAARLLLQSVLGQAATSQAAVVRRRALHRLAVAGDSAPFLALVGVSLASGSGIITKEDEIEQLCYEMKRAVSRTAGLAADQEERQWSLKDFQLGTSIAKGCSSVVYSARLRSEEEQEQEHAFPLAIKMMFNYHAESNAFTILRAMHRETVPARSVLLPPEADSLQEMLGGATVRLRAHPNIVEMVTVFADRVPALPGDVELYGTALPARLHPDGLGRNMSLFLVMKAYDLSLADFLSEHGAQLPPRTGLVLLAQLLEGVAFLASSGVAHRDLKADNLLLCLQGGPQFPHLVITDFGCCLADPRLGLTLPYRSFDTDKGGNTALMAPEVAVARPGPFASISYERSDLWTVGTLAYQIFGAENPFYSGLLSSRTYTVGQLPALPGATPPLARHLVAWLLARDPAARPSPRLAATACQLLLWAPSAWRRPGGLPDTQDVLQWLLTMTTKVVCESRWGNTPGAQLEYTLVATFLATLSLRDIRAALVWIQEVQEERIA